MRTMLIAAVALAACDDPPRKPRKRSDPCAGMCVVQEQVLPAPRGDVVDRHRVPLATNRPAQDLLVTPRTFDGPTRDALIRTLVLDDDEIARVDGVVERARKASADRPVTVLADLTPERARNATSIPGVEVAVSVARHYVQGDLAAQVVGYVLDVDGQGPIGRSGIEAEWENYLAGKPGSRRHVVDANGKIVGDEETIEAMISGDRVIDPVPGYDVVLTIDLGLQRIAEDAVAAQASSAVAILEVGTGRIRALVSKPSFDPAAMAAIRRVDLAALSADPRKPFLDKTLRESFAPAETYAFVTEIAALENGVASDVARAYGFGAPTGLGLNGDVAGNLPTVRGDVEVTVVQLAAAYAALAGGTRYVPQIVEHVQARGGKIVVAYDPQVAAPVTTAPAILDEIRRDMSAGSSGLSAILPIAGQVGTAPARRWSKHGATESHAWFAGWAPADAPEVAIVVLIPHGGDGATVAAPIARTILEGWWTTVR